MTPQLTIGKLTRLSVLLLIGTLLCGCESGPPQNGPYLEHFPNGNIKLEENYRNGKLHGLSTVYFEDGRLQRIYQYVDGLKQGPFKKYYENGQLHLEGNNKNDKLDGEIREYYEDGTPKEVLHVKEGLMEGPYLSYHPNGEIHSTGQFAADKRTGDFKHYYDNKSLLREETYIEGKPEGIVKSFFSDGTQMSIKAYKNGLPDGRTANTTGTDNFPASSTIRKVNSTDKTGSITRTGSGNPSRITKTASWKDRPKISIPTASS